MSRSEPEVQEGGVGLLAGIVSKLREGLGDDLVAIVLFGSRARGEAHEGSDWDVLILDAMVEAPEARVVAGQARLRGL